MSPAAAAEPDRAGEQARRRVVGGQDVEQARLGERRGGDVAGVRAAADQVRRADHHRDAVGAAGGGGLERGRELGDAGAVAGGGRDLRLGGVVVARERRAEPAGRGDRRGLVAGAVAGAAAPSACATWAWNSASVMPRRPVA